MYQVNKLLSRSSFLKKTLRFIQNGIHTNSKALHPLESRKLLKISGEDIPTFLQGLITNDIRHLEETSKVIYSMFLNNKGRVLYDTLIYKWHSDDAFMIECDGNVMPALQKHLKIYKLKRKLQIEDINNKYKLWALIVPSEMVPKIDIETDVALYKDPRVPDLGYRVIAAASLDGKTVAKTFEQGVTIENNEDKYKYLRYKLGVSEGATDLPPGSSFPLEANCDYLHGVSFHKGCYIGQELTARVHHTGVIRKRLMPLKFSEAVKDLEIDTALKDAENPKVNLGKLKGYITDQGLGLVRVKEASETKQLVIGKYPVEVKKPEWWPAEAPKEKINLTKVE